jgi:hypothetical protein
MPYALFTKSVRVCGPFPSEMDVWKYVRANGLCSEVLENEDHQPRRVLNPDFVIHQCDRDGHPDAVSEPIRYLNV